jgi:hypothetical protein
VAFLASETPDFGYGHSLDTGFRDRIAYIIQFERFNDRGNHFHGRFLKNSGSFDFNASIIVPQANMVMHGK